MEYGSPGRPLRVVQWGVKAACHYPTGWGQPRSWRRALGETAVSRHTPEPAPSTHGGSGFAVESLSSPTAMIALCVPSDM